MSTTSLIDFRAVKDQARFEDILDHYGIEHTGRGDQRKALCPFHEETRGSLSIHLSEKKFHCFGCGAKGSVFDFVADMEQLDRRKDIRKVADLVVELCNLTAETLAYDRGRGKAEERPSPRPAGPKPPDSGKNSPVTLWRPQ